MIKINFPNNDSNWLDKIDFLENELRKEREISKNKLRDFQNFVENGFQKILTGLEEAKNQGDVVSALMIIESVRQEMISFRLSLQEIIHLQHEKDIHHAIHQNDWEDFF